MYEDIELNLQGEVNLEIGVDISPEIVLTMEQSGSMLPKYLGPYEVVPRKIEQVLETKNKSMTDDVTVHAINYSETINPQGGNTVVIGYE